ncbi:hypothetical protein D3C76_1332930 [compost metagenome]
MGDGLSVVGAGGGHRLGTAHFVGCVETIEDHLPKTQFGLGVVQGFLVVVAGTVSVQAAGVEVVRALSAVPGYQVDGWIVPTTGKFHVLVG